MNAEHNITFIEDDQDCIAYNCDSAPLNEALKGKYQKFKVKNF